MQVRVIGAGWGRTGTSSLKKALEMLGFGPCYHWAEVRPEHVPAWERAIDGDEPDWSAVFESFGSVVDWPAAYFWRELSAYYPNAKIILSTRDPEEWFDSATETIYRIMTAPLDSIPPRPGWDADTLRRLIVLSRRIIIERTLGGTVEEGVHEDRGRVVEKFREHLAQVIEAVPPERLLVFEASQGWEPLCELLAVPVPAEAFPHKNARASFQRHHAVPSES